MDTLATLLNKSLENINKLNDEMNKLKASHIALMNKYNTSCQTISILEKKINTIENRIDPSIAIDKVELENVMIKLCRENPNNLGPKGPIGDKGPMGDT